jgi:uncharacterized phiE125 gp8 family phage protein
MEPRYKVKTEATTYPASLADVKRNLRIATTDIDTDRDTLLQDLIYDAVTASQNSTGRQYCAAEIYGYLDEYPVDGLIEISKGPVSEITSIKYWAPDGIAMTDLDESEWELDNSELTARVKLLNIFSVDTDKLNAIEIEYKAGFSALGNQADSIPTDIKQAVILRACYSYLHPENAEIGKEPKAAESKERNYKVQRY